MIFTRHANLNQGPLPQCHLQHPRPQPNQTYQCPPGTEFGVGQGHQGVPCRRRGPLSPGTQQRAHDEQLPHDTKSISLLTKTLICRSCLFPPSKRSACLLLQLQHSRQGCLPSSMRGVASFFFLSLYIITCSQSGGGHFCDWRSLASQSDTVANHDFHFCNVLRGGLAFAFLDT